jgi:hypothetical protein
MKKQLFILILAMASIVIAKSQCGPTNLVTYNFPTTNFVPKFGATNTCITNSLIFDNGTNVGISLTNPNFKLDVNGDISVRPLNAGYRIGNSFVLWNNGNASNIFCRCWSWSC